MAFGFSKNGFTINFSERRMKKMSKTAIPKPWKDESELSFEDLTDCLDGLIQLFDRNSHINCDAFDRVFKAKTCLKEIKHIVVNNKNLFKERISRCQYARFDADGCYCEKYKVMSNCTGTTIRCLKDYIS